MTTDNQRFELLAVQFEKIAHELNACEDAAQRRELLLGMMVILEQLVDLGTDEHSSLNSRAAGTVSANLELAKGSPPIAPVKEISVLPSRGGYDRIRSTISVTRVFFLAHAQSLLFQ